MPFFGLVWVASWVSCFFPSHQALLKQPRYLSETLPLPIVSEFFDRSKLPISLERLQSTVYGAVSSRSSAVSVASPHATAAATPAVDRAENSLRPAWWRAANRLFSPSTEARSPAVIPVSYSSASASSAPTIAQVASHSVSMIQNFVWGWRLVAGMPRAYETPAVTVNSASWPGVEDDCKGSSLPSAPRPCVLMPVSTAAAQRPATRPATIFQVRVKNQVVAEVPSQQQASQIAQQLRQLISNPQFDPTQLQPGFDRKVPAGRFGDRVLFTVDRSIARAWGCHAEVLAVRWVNALRSTLDEAPIALADAQAKMHSLKETESEIHGLASWYGPHFNGKQTATGEIFDQDALTAAHPSLPFDTYLKVTNLKNGRTVIVRVNDRGPYFDDRTLDLSQEAARLIDSEHTGVVPITARIMQPVKDSAPPPQSLAQL